MDGPSTSNPLLQPTQNLQQVHDWKPKKKNKKQRSQKAPPVKEASKANYSSYMRDKGYSQNEMSMVAQRCPAFVSLSEDRCPRPLRLATINYPKEWLHKTEDVPRLREFLMKRNGRKKPRVLDVVSVDGYALVLCNDKFTFDSVRRWLPELEAEIMALRQPSKKNIAEYSRARRERIAVEGRGYKRKNPSKSDRLAKRLAKAAASSDPNDEPPSDINDTAPSDLNGEPPSDINNKPPSDLNGEPSSDLSEPHPPVPENLPQ